MEALLAKRVDELVECGWIPRTTTETTASLVGRRPFSWWLFVLALVLFPVFGGMVYLIFWYLTSSATVFLHQDADRVAEVGDVWLVRMQEARREAFISEQRAIKESGFLAVMWPKLVTFLLFLFIWIAFLRWYMH
jgi:hypothetical protein